MVDVVDIEVLMCVEDVEGGGGVVVGEFNY